VTDEPPLPTFCKDCSYQRLANYVIWWGLDRHRYAKCAAPHQASGDGWVHPGLDSGSFCSLMRMEPKKCGPDARWFVPKGRT